MKITDALIYGATVKKGGASGSVLITENGIHDVAQYASADVQVPAPQPSLIEKNINSNGSYSAQSEGADGYSSVNVNVPTAGNEDAIVSGTISGSYTNNNATAVHAYCFYGNWNLSEIYFANATLIKEHAFENCQFLRVVDLPKATNIGDAVFKGALKSVDGVSVNAPLAQTLGTDAFSNCWKLQSIELPSAIDIGNTCFSSCVALTTVDLAENGISGHSIGKQAFFNDTALTALILRNTNAVWTLSTRTLNGTPIASGTGYIYVPAALVSTYQAATNWSEYAAQFRALENYTVDGTTTGALDPTKI